MSNIIVITGGTSGYGKAAAQKFAARGETVVVASRNKQSLQQTKDELESIFFPLMLLKLRTGMLYMNM